MNRNAPLNQGPAGEGAASANAKGHGCFFYGCLTTVILLVVAGVAGGLLAWKVKSMAMAYTSDKPDDIARVELPAPQMQALTARIETFKREWQEDKPGRLVLTETDINALLAGSAELEASGSRVSVKIEGDQVVASLSVPTDKMGLKGRYLNGRAKLRVGLQAGRLLVFIDQIEANGKALPEFILKELRSKNLAEDAMNDPDAAAAISKIKALTVSGGTITVEK